MYVCVCVCVCVVVVVVVVVVVQPRVTKSARPVHSSPPRRVLTVPSLGVKSLAPSFPRMHWVYEFDAINYLSIGYFYGERWIRSGWDGEMALTLDALLVDMGWEGMTQEEREKTALSLLYCHDD